MPTFTTIELPPPKSWDEFEDICADLFGRMWGDLYAVRHGRSGQRQNGVDILGNPEAGGIAGVQCKGRQQFPPIALTTGEIDTQVAYARKYDPPLSEFIIATTVLDDAKLQDHAAAISDRHAKHGLFRVHIFGWNELSRRINDYPELIEKHYLFVTLATVRNEIADTHDTTRLVLKKVGELSLNAATSGVSPSSAGPTSIDTLKPDLAEAIERDLTLRYDRALQRALFPEESKSDAFYLLAKEVLAADFSRVSPSLRRRILLRAARSRALRNEIAEAQRLLDAGLALEGPEPGLPARARVMEARDEVEAAIRLLRDSKDPDCRSTLLSVLARQKGDEAALAWFKGENLAPPDLTANGIVTLCQIYLRQNDFDGLARTHAQTTEQQCLENPHLFFFRGAVRLASTVAKPDRERVLQGIPLNARFAHTVLPESEFPAYLDEAIADLQRMQAFAAELGLREAGRIAEAYVRWCELLHPSRKEAALAKLRREMANLKTALPLVQFALAYDSDFDPKPLVALLEKREALGGLDDDELRAAFVLQLDSGDPRSVADFIGKHRAGLEKGYGRQGILPIEIQALAMARDTTSARLLLDENIRVLRPDLAALLAAEIAKAEGADPVAEHKRVYEATKTPEALRALVAALAAKKDHRAVARYAEELYGHTGDPNDIAVAARALVSIGDNANFLRVIEAYPFVEKADPALARHNAWLLFQLGRFTEAKRLTDEFHRIGPEQRDLDLEVAIAIESGDWPSLGAILPAYMESPADRGGHSLIRAAHIAQAAGQGPMMALAEAAVAASPDDPNVLIGAYTLVLEEGLGDKKPEAAEWFSRALDFSGPDGPVKRFELKDLLSRQGDWSDHTRQINDALLRGDMPLFLAAMGFRTTLADLVLRNFVRNSTIADPRRRVAIPVLSGRRGPRQIPETRRLAIDVSGLLVLGWLGLLPKVIEAYPEIVIPAGALGELFEAQRRIREFQASRIAHAQHVNEAITSGRLKVLRSDTGGDDLAKEVGIEVAALIEAAKTRNGIFLRPAPIHRLGLEEKDADMSEHAVVLADLHALLAVLVDLGALDQRAEDTARRYFEVQDRGWSAPATPSKDRPLFLDGLTVVYLQTVNLLDTVLDWFDEVYVHSSTQEEASGVVDYDRQSREILRIIEAIRDALHKGSEAGRVVFGPRTSRGDDDEDGPESSSMHLLGDLAGADVVLIDDRALNKEAFAADRKGQRAHVVHSLDIIDDLQARGVLPETNRDFLRHRLRIAGAALVPAGAEEIAAAALRNRQNESPEFRAIRESIYLARAAEVPRFPAEIPWYASLATATKSAIISVWKRERDTARAALLADAILDLQLSPENWIASWSGTPPPKWVEIVTCVIAASLAMPIEIDGEEAVAAYNKWLEKRLLGPLRATAPERYQALVEHVKAFIAAASEDEDD